MKKIIAIAVVGVVGVYLLNRFVKSKPKKDCGCSDGALEAKVKDAANNKVVEVTSQVVTPAPKVYPSVVDQQYAITPIIPAKTVIITTPIPFKTPITMNDMVLKNNKIRYA
jgi:hypothetical protein